ncbi:MAG: hypothetical protein H6741_18875 [Alphaproteobacteria bacterium]|nr:hypothetical protein [Alphaproteobacteria bacterium]MCB9794774.1 hypothetical protein [Alphaproteobacteria bacterium]
MTFDLSAFDAAVVLVLALVALALLRVIVVPKTRLASTSRPSAPPPEAPAPPPDVPTLLREADRLIGEGELLAASVKVSQATALEPERPGLLFVRGRLEHARGEPELAIKLFERACQARPEVAPWHVARGHLLMELARPDLAAEAFSQALDCDPERADAVAGLAAAQAAQP